MVQGRFGCAQTRTSATRTTCRHKTHTNTRKRYLATNQSRATSHTCKIPPKSKVFHRQRKLRHLATHAIHPKPQDGRNTPPTLKTGLFQRRSKGLFQRKILATTFRTSCLYIQLSLCSAHKNSLGACPRVSSHNIPGLLGAQHPLPASPSSRFAFSSCRRRGPSLPATPSPIPSRRTSPRWTQKRPLTQNQGRRSTQKHPRHRSRNLPPH